MKRSGDEFNFSEGQRSGKSRKTLNFARADCDGTEGNASSSSSIGDVAGPETAKEKLKRKLLQRKDDGAEILESWLREILAANLVGEILDLTIEHSPFERSDETATPGRVLVLYPSEKHTYDKQAGPFQPVRLIVNVDRSWSLQCPVYEHMIIKSGKLQESANGAVVDLAKNLLCSNQTLCPGFLEDVEALGYEPKNIRIMAGPVRSLHSKRCKIWHIPPRLTKERLNASDPRWKRVCLECLDATRYVKNQVKKKKNLDETTKLKRQTPSSHFPWRYLSPGSKTKRARNIRQQRSRLSKHVQRFYKRTKIELPGEQSKELCNLIQAIEGSETGQRELKKITAEGNKLEGKGGLKAGDCISEVWQKDRASFFKDQQSNVTGKKGNRWSLSTIRVALAVYNRSPSAYEALRNLSILQLPCTKVLKNVLKEGAEQPGIDNNYFQSQRAKYKEYQEQRESGGHPQPLGIGVMMWDEVKIQMKVAWNLKGGSISGFTMAPDELPVLDDVYTSAIQSGCQKASYIVQFLWRDLTSGYDMIGPYFPVSSSVDSNILQEFFLLSLKAFSNYGFKVSIVLCDGASSNLTLLKLLCGSPRATLPVNEDADDLRGRYFANMSFVNPEDPSGNPIFAMICPSHQLKNMIAALYSSRPTGSKKLTIEGRQFGWETIEKIYDQEMKRAETGRSRKVPGLKYAFVYRDNWTRLNVKPAKIMQQRYMISAIKDLSEEPNQDRAKPVASYLEACNLIFENGLLSRRRINSLNSPVIQNIKKGMDFFEKWCRSHEETVYPDNTKKSRQTKFLAWQTWDLLRVVVHGFLLFCAWFFTYVSPDGRYFISPLRINGSALESIFSVLKHTSGGNLSAIAYSPALGRLINRKDLVVNQHSEKGYRDQILNIDGQSITADNQISVKCTNVSRSLCQFSFPPTIAQSSLGGRQGSNACTIIAVRFGDYAMMHKLDISLLWGQLPQLWITLFVNAICDGNHIYDDHFGDTAVYLDVEDIVQASGTECNVQSVSAIFGFNNANGFADLAAHLGNVLQPSYGVLIANDKSVGILVQANGLCALIDSHVHNNSGAVILMADCPSNLITAYSRLLLDQNLVLNIGTFTWVHYLSA